MALKITGFICMEKFNYPIFFEFVIIKKPTLKIYQRITNIMLNILNKLNSIGFNSIENFSYFFSFGIIKKPTPKIYQNMIKFVKPPLNILTDPTFKNKLFWQTDKHVDEKRVFKNFIVKSSLIGTSIRLFFSNILSIVILSVHLMSFDSRCIKNVRVSYAPAPISTSAPATPQGIFSVPHTLCTPENSMNKTVLHSPGTSSVMAQPETCSKLHLSISEILRDLGRHYFKFNSIITPTFIEAFKTKKQINYLSFQIIFENQITCVLCNPPCLLNLKFVYWHQPYSNIINKKFKTLSKIYSLFLFISVSTLYSCITTYILSNTRHSTQLSSYGGI